MRKLCASGTLHHVQGRCVDLVEHVDEVVLTLESGRILATEFAVLATGNDTKPDLSGIPAVKPWSQTTLAEIDGRSLSTLSRIDKYERIAVLRRQRAV